MKLNLFRIRLPIIIFALVLIIMLAVKINSTYILFFILAFWGISFVGFGFRGLIYKDTKILSRSSGWFTQEATGKYAIFWPCIYLVFGFIILGILSFILLQPR